MKNLKELIFEKLKIGKNTITNKKINIDIDNKLDGVLDIGYENIDIKEIENFAYQLNILPVVITNKHGQDNYPDPVVLYLYFNDDWEIKKEHPIIYFYFSRRIDRIDATFSTGSKPEDNRFTVHAKDIQTVCKRLLKKIENENLL